MLDPEMLARPNIQRLKPYSSARSEFGGSAEVYLDANENAFGSPTETQLHRYPDPLQRTVKERLAAVKGVTSDQIFVGNGSDEAIDLLFRIFCEPGRDQAIICPPTYGMYKVAADINDITVREIPLIGDFQLDAAAIVGAASEAAKLVFICSPNNPTGNVMNREDVLMIAENFPGIVVVDEAYIDFAPERSLISEIGGFPNLVVLQTFSKAWGMAGARVGLAFGNPKLIELFNRVKPPYNVSRLAQDAILDALENGGTVDKWVTQIREQRSSLRGSLADLEIVETVYPSDANFLLVKFGAPESVYNFLLSENIVVRDRSNVVRCERCLRITVGTPEENSALIASLRRCEKSGGAAAALTEIAI
jgi:histidinol-phosphate aminotransferase